MADEGFADRRWGEEAPPPEPARPEVPERSREDGAPPAQPWSANGGLVWTTTAGLTLLALGAVLGRPDLALLALAPLLTALSAAWLRPRGPVWADLVAPAPTTDVGVLAQTVRLTTPQGAVGVRVRIARPGHGSQEALVHVPFERDLELSARSVRTGPQVLFRFEHQGLGAGALTSGPHVEEEPGTVVVLPRGRTMPALPMPARLRGLTGQHESRRFGQGGALRDVHPFLPGDSPRQIDWKVTARRSPGLDQLYVRRTYALGEAAVVLVVDSRDDVGPDPTTWSGIHPVRPDDATSLDLARQAALTVAEGYLAVGDRVAVEDLGVRRRALRPGTGRHQLDRLVQQLGLLRPEGDPPTRIRPPRMPAGSLVYVFSTFLDPEAADMARAWRRAGITVIAVDVLPATRTRGLDARHWLALRLVRVERDDRIAELTHAGIQVLRWSDPDDVTGRLQLAAARSHRRPGRGMGAGR